MQVPAILYGEVKVVRKRCKAALRRWLAGTPYIAAMEADGVYEVADLPTPITLELWRGDWDLGLYLSMPTHLLLGEGGLLIPKWPQPLDQHDPRLVAFFDASLTRPRALLSLLEAQDARMVFGPLPAPDLDRFRRYIAAVLRDCDELEAVGARYGPTSARPDYLARCAYRVYGGLRALSYPTERLNLNDLLRVRSEGAPEPDGGLRGVLAALGVPIDPVPAPEWLPDQPTVLPAPPPPPAREPVDPAEIWMSQEMEQALETHDQEAVKRLIAAGESPERINGDLDSPLRWAIRHGYTDLVRFLLDHGAPIEDRGPEGESPLMDASVHGHTEIVHLLLERGARVRYRSEKGEDALDYARLGGHREIEALLREARKGTGRRRPGG